MQTFVKMKQSLKSFIKLAMKYDGFWSAPLAFLLFCIAGTLSFKYFGDRLISIEYVQQMVLSAVVMVFINFTVFLGMRFNFKGLQDYFFSKQARIDGQHFISPWQKICLYVVIYFSLFAAFLFILRTVMTATR